MKYILGIDFGGGASKATLLRQDGTVAASNTTEYPTIYPKPGFAEQRPSDWIEAACKNIHAVLQKSGILPCEIKAVALDAATHTAVLMDDNFQVLRNAIYWTDTRSAKEVQFLNNHYASLIKQQALHSPETIWTLPVLLWIKNNEPQLWARVKKIAFAKDYVRFFLTKKFSTDYIEAEGSMLFDFDTMTWSKDLCGILDITDDMLPVIIKPTDIAGVVTNSAAAKCGLRAGTPVVCGTTDTVMEVFASGAVKKGQMTLKLATAGRICVVTDRPYPNTHLVNYSHIVDGLFYPGTATKSCAASYRWFRDTFGDDYLHLDKLASDIAIGSDGLVFHPYLNGELTPYANPKLCANFIGIRSSHTKAHFARAVLEGVALSMLDCKTVLDNLNIPHENCAAVIGGGGKSPLWRQIIADTLGMRLLVMKRTDSSFGSAMLAGVAAGIFADAQDALKRCNFVVSETLPDAERSHAYKRLFKKYKLIQQALEPIYNEYYD